MGGSTDKYRDMSAQELQDEESKLAEQCFKLRIQKAKGQLENPQRIKMIRRDIARIKTVRRELELAGGRQGEE